MSLSTSLSKVATMTTYAEKLQFKLAHLCLFRQWRYRVLKRPLSSNLRAFLILAPCHYQGIHDRNDFVSWWLLRSCDYKNTKEREIIWVGDMDHPFHESISLGVLCKSPMIYMTTQVETMDRWQSKEGSLNSFQRESLNSLRVKTTRVPTHPPLT